MESIPSFSTRVFEFASAVFGNAWGFWGSVLSTLIALLAAAAKAFTPDDVRARVEHWLPSTPAHRRAALRNVFIANSVLVLAVSCFQAFDEVNEKLRASQAEVALLKSADSQRQAGPERAGHQMELSGQLSKFHSRGLELLSAEIIKEQYPIWLQHSEEFVKDAADWVEANLGQSAKDQLLAKHAFPRLMAWRSINASHAEKLSSLDAVVHNIPGLMQDFAINSANSNLTTAPSLPLLTSPTPRAKP